MAEQARGTWFRVLAVFALGVGCGGGGGSQSAASNATESSNRTPEQHYTTGEEVVPPGAVADLIGAALAPPEPTIPADTVPLASRMTPRELDIPRTRVGRTSRFVFDGFHRGWFARLPQGQQRLLTPIYGAGKVFIGAGFSSNSVYAYDARTGEREWQASAPDGGPSAAILEDGKVLFNTESCTLFAVDANTGRQIWSRWLGDPLMSQPSAANGLVFSGHILDGQSPGGLQPGTTGFGVGEGRRYGLTAMSLRNGQPRWTRAISADVMNAPVLVGDDVFITTMDGVVSRMEQRTGRVTWRRRLNATSAPWLDGDDVHVTVRLRQEGVAMERALVLAKASGETLREHEPVPARFAAARPDTDVAAGWGYEGSRASVIEGRVYQTIGNEVHCRDADTNELLWRRRYTDDTRARPASPPAIAGSQLVFGTEDGTLFGLDIDTGMTAWAYDVGEPISAQPTVAHGWVFASTTRGGLVALEVSDTSFDGWHMWGGNASHNGRVMNSEPPAEVDERPSEGTLALEGAARAGETAGFPLTGTRVNATVSGFVANVEVEQTFRNPYNRPVEAVYLFPLPEDSAVDAMELRIGERVVHAQIRRRHEAQAAYRDARDRGVLASLLEQERPNLFRQSVANIRPGDEVRVALRYTQVLPYEEGSYRFVYPMVAGARYQPEDGDAPANDGTPEGTEQVVLAPGGERPDRVEVSLSGDFGIALREVSSPSHEIDVEQASPERATVHLREPARPDRDLDIRFLVAGEAPALSVLANPPVGETAGNFALSIHPTVTVADEQVMPRELVFVMDTSSSMNGRPMELARAATLRALSGMRPSDTFRVLSFSDTTSALSDTPLPATPENVTRARAFVNGLRAIGATEMVRGLRAALDPPGEPGRMRVVLLMTDGFIGNETEIFQQVHQRLGQSRVFAFGVGSAVNRYLLTRLAEVGRGDAQVVTLTESPEDAADRFHERIARPFLTDISIDWGGLHVESAYPRRVPDLYADRPVVIHARYAQGGEDDITVRGRIAGRAFEQTLHVSLPSSGTARPELSSVWARTRIRDLMTAMELSPNATLQEEVTQLGLTHHLLTQWTAFIAIDESYHADGTPRRVHQPSMAPAGNEAPAMDRAPPPVSATPAARMPMRASVRATDELLDGWEGAAPSPPMPSPTVVAPEPRLAERNFEGGAVGAPVGGGGGDVAGLSRGRRGVSNRGMGDGEADAEGERGPSIQRPARPIDCRALATRPDGTFDQQAYEACLRSQGARKGAGFRKALGDGTADRAAALLVSPVGWLGDRRRVTH